jgi:5'-3' exonuclease
MERLSRAIDLFVHMKMKTDARWQRLTVIFSGAEVRAGPSRGRL